MAAVTKPRTSPHRELYGILGTVPDVRGVLRKWNAYFRLQGMDAFMDRYPATARQLPERLSEMFHFDRRLYIVGKSLQKVILPLLDGVDSFAKGGVDCVVNEGGILRGYWVGEGLDDPERVMEWMECCD
ncbi:TPA: hypothetical protein DCL30_02940 [Candidatus Peribacteria bacterium]|nr:MAG: hypothetical protein A3J91_00190 [Candidatus Peribacteria bacterium RIFOXYC2_FULL_58_10]OGJ84685.1 MAG: hypothetical protein A2529_03970 [Candidatus Peribacteria bacterium RIFOXYD2_FULL_58_15]HAI98476.1 hypothetical protein [Candidatus Peribacteria bacterium]HAS34188.1 hypothetical protein [Candidatus Peribacteria bacterium]